MHLVDDLSALRRRHAGQQPVEGLLEPDDADPLVYLRCKASQQAPVVPLCVPQKEAASETLTLRTNGDDRRPLIEVGDWGR